MTSCITIPIFKNKKKLMPIIHYDAGTIRGCDRSIYTTTVTYGLCCDRTINTTCYVNDNDDIHTYIFFFFIFILFFFSFVYRHFAACPPP